MARRPLPVTSTLDKDRVVFDGDRKLRGQLERHAALQEVAAEAARLGADPMLDPMLGMPPMPAGRRSLLRTSVRLTRGLAPSLWASVDHCTKYLGVDRPVELYVQQEPAVNASVIPPEDGRILICVTSAAIERLTDTEMASVIGHELGHVIYDHLALMPLFQFSADDRIAPVDSMRIVAWMRYAELTADRVGLLCCDDLDAAVSAEFKIASGLSDPRHYGNVKEVAGQFAAIAEDKLPDSEIDWMATHPYSPLRLRAMELFYRSTTYHALQGRRGGAVGERELEREVAQIVALMNPSALGESGPDAVEVRELLAVAGLHVAMADRRLDDLEERALGKLVGKEALVAHLDGELAKSKRAREVRLTKLTRQVAQHLPRVRRRKLLEDLCAIALADKIVDDAERNVLTELAMLLDVDPLDVDAFLGRIDAPLD